MKKYYRIMLGQKSIYAEEAYQGGFIGAGWFENLDLTNKLTEEWRDFNKKYIPVFLKKYSDKSRVAAGLACGMLHTITKGINKGDIVLSPDGEGSYFVGEVVSDYEYKKGEILPHRRKVNWFSGKISRDEMSEALKNSAGSIGTVSDISGYAQEIEKLLSGNQTQIITTNDEIIEEPSIFALEKHLEDFLVQNWENTKLGKEYEIYKEEDNKFGQQFPTDTGRIDILAISKDKKELLVVELKKGRASDAVVGQVQCYMGYVQEILAEKGQKVRGVIIAFEDDDKIQRALLVASNIDFYTYKINFRLEKKRY